RYDLKLLGEVAVLGHSRELHDAAERQLAPAPAHLRPAERRHEIARFALQLRMAVSQPLDLRAERGERIAPLPFECLHLRFGFLQRLPQRLNELRDGGLALLQRALGDELLAPECFAREVE